MDITKVGPIAALLLAIPLISAAETVDTSAPPTMVVRTFSYVKISSSDLQRARIQADGILGMRASRYRGWTAPSITRRSRARRSAARRSAPPTS